MLAAFFVIYLVPLDVKPVFHYCYMKKFYADLRSEDLYVCNDDRHLNFKEKVKKDNSENNNEKLYAEEDSDDNKSQKSKKSEEPEEKKWINYELTKSQIIKNYVN